jgi:hypothetical protein
MTVPRITNQQEFSDYVESELRRIENTPGHFTRENFFAYFDQMSEKDGTFITTADWLADTAMLIVHEATKSTKGEVT